MFSEYILIIFYTALAMLQSHQLDEWYMKALDKSIIYDCTVRLKKTEKSWRHSQHTMKCII